MRVPEIHTGLCYRASNREKRVMLAVSIRTARLTTRLMPRIGAHEGQAALLAGQPDEAAYSASGESNWHPQENRMAHFPTLLRHVAEGKRRGCRNRSGAPATREQSNHGITLGV